MSEDLETLRSRVNELSETIKTLKSSTSTTPDKDAITKAVNDLLEAKQSFANANGGIGVDGKKYEPPLTKAEKKKRDKEAKAKAAAAAAGGDGGGAGGKEVQTSANAAKKAAKKAEAKAKKAAKKAEAATTGPSSTPTPTPTPSSKPSKPSPSSSSSKSKLSPLELCYNPNAPLIDRPIIALSTAILTNTILDITIVSDHNRYTAPGLGLEGGGELVGDAAIARYLARRAAASLNNNNMGIVLMGGGSNSSQATIDQWIDYALTMSKLDIPTKVKAIVSTLNHTLSSTSSSTFLAGYECTMADLALYKALGSPAQIHDLNQIRPYLPSEEDNCPAIRWMKTLSSHPAIREAIQLAVGISSNTEAIFDEGSELEPLITGMNPLQGAYAGSVVTRFPPEPSGYLHVGHAKAVLLNDYYARRYKGRLIVRFDDTNPSKEKEEYQESILSDLEKLNVHPDSVTYTSDYFPTIKAYAMELIHKGLAFMDDTPQDIMQKERMERINSKHRNQSIQDCLQKFHSMCSGKSEGGGKVWCLRAKINMLSVNGTMRDPVIYRQNIQTPHHRSGTKYKAYPTYDLACPIVDSIEGVSHALRTTEYNDRDEQYQWIQTSLNIRRVRIHAFARMNFAYTVLSKRKLAWFVDEGYVTGWDDARFPTVQGVLRRGINIRALRAFICSQGASRRVVNMEWSKFWAENKKEIDKTAKRFMAIDKNDHVQLHITNGPGGGDGDDGDGRAYVSTDYLPKDPSYGKRLVRISSQVLLERVDTEGIEVDEEIVLMRWGVVKITKVDTTTTPPALEGEFIPNGNIKAAKRKLSWISNTPNNDNTKVLLTEFDNLLTKDKLEDDDDIKNFINPTTMATSEVIGDVGLKNLQEHEIIQLERRGYYRVDRPFVNDGMKPLVLFMIPDGKAKAMSGLTGKLAHH